MLIMVTNKVKRQMKQKLVGTVHRSLVARWEKVERWMKKVK